MHNDYDLTSREIDVLRCLVKGCSNSAIAEELEISLATVKAHMSAIFEKLDVSDRTQTAIKAINENIV